MKVGGRPPAPDAGPRLDQAYGLKTGRPAATIEAAVGSLDPGRLLKGRVVSIDGAGVLTIATELGPFKAATASPLELGREFWFQVVRGGANPVLAEAGKTNAVLNLLRVLLPGMIAADGPALAGSPLPAVDGQEMNQGAARLSRFLAANAVDGRADPGKLLKLISRLNLSPPFAEARARGLPAGPLAAWQDLEAPAVQKLARLLEAHGAVNQQAAPGAGGDYFLFPVFFAEQAGRGEWLFSFERGGEGTEGQSSTAAISFYLAMSQLGDIHLSITSRPNSLTGIFTLTTDAAADHVRQHLPQLTQALKPLADKIALTCRTAQFDCLKTLKDDLTAQAGLEERFALVDLKA